MLRGLFISLSKAHWAQRLITRWGFAWRAASRFVAGETIPDALRAAAQMNAAGINVTLDHLGENTSSAEEARQSTEDAVEMLREIEKAGARAGMSIKLTQIGMSISDDLCRQNLLEILRAARDCSNFIRIDMEDASLVDRTLAMYDWAREQGFDNLGVVIQAYLYRSENDIRRLLEKNARIRLVKGAYNEPADVAFPKKKDTDANYDRLVTLILTHVQQQAEAPLLSQDGRFPPAVAVASHDIHRIDFARGLAQKLGITPTAIEFQMLYGIRRDLQKQLVKAGYPVRVYVPYGTHWYPYLMRRLAERPANLWFFLSNFFRR